MPGKRQTTGFLLVSFLAIFFLLPSVSALNITSVGITDSNYDQPPYVTGTRLDAVMTYTDGNSSYNATLSLYTDNTTALSDVDMEYDTGGRFIYEQDSILIFDEASDWTAEVTLTAPDSNTTIHKERFNVRNPVDLTLFLVLSGISILCIAVGFGGFRLFGIIGVIIMFFLGLILLQGQLALPDGELQTVQDNATITEDTYDNWNTGDYHTIGWLIAVVGGFMFVVFLMDPGGRA